jgi:hypothetical protein
MLAQRLQDGWPGICGALHVSFPAINIHGEVAPRQPCPFSGRWRIHPAPGHVAARSDTEIYSRARWDGQVAWKPFIQTGDDLTAEWFSGFPSLNWTLSFYSQSSDQANCFGPPLASSPARGFWPGRAHATGRVGKTDGFPGINGNVRKESQTVALPRKFIAAGPGQL